MRSKLLALFLLLCLQTTTFSQDMLVGDAIPQTDVDKAVDTLKRVAPKALSLDPGTFFVLPQKNASPLAWDALPGSAVGSILKVDMAAGATITHYGIKLGDKEAKLHTLTAATPWSLIIGVKPGVLAYKIWGNGSNPTKPPVQVDQIKITVGTPPPAPDDPPAPDPNADKALTNRLAVAFAKDMVAGKGDKATVKKLAGVYNAAANDPLTDYKTFNDLDNFLIQTVATAGIPDYTKVLTQLRTQIQQEIFTGIPVDETSRNTAMTDANRTNAKAVFAKLSASLKVVGQ